MIPRNELHVVFGTGPVGLAVMRELHGQEKCVRLVNRSGTATAPESVEVVKGMLPLTTRQMLTLFFDEAHLPPRMGSVPNLMIRMLGLVNPTLREVAEMLYEFNEPFVVDSSKFVQAFGDIATSHREAIRQTLEWYRPRAQTKAA